jgi:uncharacterized repeat protein (TIGR01451 family)
MNVTASATSPIHAVTNVSTTDVDPNLTNNAASANTQFVSNVNPVVDLSLAMSATPSVLHPAEMITFTYVVTNHGGMVASGVAVGTTYPANVTFVSGSAGCDATHCDVGTLASGESATVTTYGVATTIGYDSAAAQASSIENDPNQADNSVSQAVMVLPLATGKRRGSHH